MIKLLAAAVIAAAAGGSAGAGAAALTGGDAPSAAVVRTSSPAATATTGRTSPSASPRPATTTARAPARAVSLRVSVLYARLRAGVSPADVASHTARLTVQVRVTNLTSRAIELARPQLGVDGRSIGADTVTTNLLPLAARTSARAVVRFATTGTFTDRLTSAKRAKLKFGTRLVPVTVRIAESGR